MSDFIVRGIPAAIVPKMWEFALPYIKRALDHTSGEVAPDDLLKLCVERAMQLWLVNHENRVVGAVTTEIVTYPHRKHCRVVTLAGSDFANWLPIIDATLCEWATAQGCDALESYVRKGLVPKLAAHGYRHKHSILVKELHHEQQQ